MKVVEKNKQDEDELEIILAEYQLLQSFRQNIVDAALNRTKFYFSIVPAVVGVATILSQIIGVNEIFKTSILLLDLYLLLLGITTLNRIIESQISAVTYTRGINRIRRYFVEKHSNLEKYFLLPTTDDVPKFQTIGFSRTKIISLGQSTAVIFTNSFLASFALYAVSTYFKLSPIIYIGITILAFLATVIFQYRGYKKKVKTAESSFKSRFPRT